MSSTHLSSLSPAVSPGLARSCWVARGSWRQLAVVSGRGCSCCCCFSRYFLYLMLVLRTLSAIVAQSRLVLAAFSLLRGAGGLQARGGQPDAGFSVLEIYFLVSSYLLGPELK